MAKNLSVTKDDLLAEQDRYRALVKGLVIATTHPWDSEAVKAHEKMVVEQGKVVEVKTRQFKGDAFGGDQLRLDDVDGFTEPDPEPQHKETFGPFGTNLQTALEMHVVASHDAGSVGMRSLARLEPDRESAAKHLTAFNGDAVRQTSLRRAIMEDLMAKPETPTSVSFLESRANTAETMALDSEIRCALEYLALNSEVAREEVRAAIREGLEVDSPNWCVVISSGDNGVRLYEAVQVAPDASMDPEDIDGYETEVVEDDTNAGDEGIDDSTGSLHDIDRPIGTGEFAFDAPPTIEEPDPFSEDFVPPIAKRESEAVNNRQKVMTFLEEQAERGNKRAQFNEVLTGTGIPESDLSILLSEMWDDGNGCIEADDDFCSVIWLPEDEE